MEKLTLVADEKGNIISTVHMPPETVPSRDAPTQVSIMPLPGQQVYELQVDDDLIRRVTSEDFHETHRIVITHGKPRITRRRSTK